MVIVFLGPERSLEPQKLECSIVDGLGDRKKMLYGILNIKRELNLKDGSEGGGISRWDDSDWDIFGHDSDLPLLLSGVRRGL